MARRLLRRPAPLVVDLRRRHMPMPKQLLDLADIDACLQEQRRGRRPERVRGVKATFLAVRFSTHRAGKPF